MSESQNNQPLVAALASFATVAELEASETYAQHQAALRKILYEPQLQLCPAAQPHIRDFLRVAHWNIERGNNFAGVLHYLKNDDRIKDADLLLLNELDVGMTRTNNRHIAFELGRELGCHALYFAEYLEFTKGVGEELNLSGENTAALHGNAILSRYPLSNPRVIDLPVCFDHFNFHEKRYGRRIAIVVDVDFNGQQLTAVATHLEVRNTPVCRARQMQKILAQLAEWRIERPIILAGDFNSNGFARGTGWRTIRGGLRVLLSNPEKLIHKLIHPDKGAEPLFNILKQHGYNLWEFNTAERTTRIPLDMIEESKQVPAFLQRWIGRRLAQYDYELYMRLDWLAGRGVRALAFNEILDRASGIASNAPQTLLGLRYDDKRASDHAPIAADIQVIAR